MDRSSDQRWHENAHELSEDMTEREQIKKPKWMENALVPQVFSYFALDRLKVRENIAMSNDDALWLSGCSGGKHDLQRIFAAQRNQRRRSSFFGIGQRREALKVKSLSIGAF